LSGVRTFDGSGTVVGLSASVQCYYIDDMPSIELDNTVSPVTLVATLITSGYTVEETKSGYVPSYINSVIKDENDHSIRALQPTHLKITTNGITPINNVVWLNAYTPYTVTVHPDAPYEDVILKNFPQANFTVNEFTQGQYGIEFDTPIEFNRFDSDNFDTGGYFRGSFHPTVSSDQTAIIASGTVEYGSVVEAFGAWVSNPTFNEVVYITADSTGSNFLSAVYTIPNSQIYGVARVTGDVNDASWLTDPTNDKVYRISRSFGVDRVFDLTTYPGISAFIAENDFGVTPTCIALNSIWEPWVSLFDAVSTIKLDPDTGAILAVAVPPVSAIFIDVPGVNGFGGEYTVRPTKIEVDKSDNIWVAYNHPLSSFLCKFANDGTFITKVDLPMFSKPFDMVSDNLDYLWVTMSYTVSSLSGAVAIYNNSGGLINWIESFQAPSYITLDQHQNPWITHGYNKVSRISTDDYSVTTFTLSSDVLSGDPPPQITLNGLYDQELGGIACDWFNRVWVLNTYDNKIYMLSATTTGNLDNELQIYPYAGSFQYSLQAYGDWTGLEWYNKFGSVPIDQIGTVVTLNLSGVSNDFAVYDFKSMFDVRKVNEDFDGVNKIRALALQPNISRNDILFNKLIAPIAGTYEGDPLLIGTALYEKIANFVGNQADVDVANIHALYSLFQMVDIPIDQYDPTYPADIKRLMDLLSVSLTRLKPTRSQFDKDFKKYNVSSSGKNIGKLLSSSTTVSAGDKVVMNIKYSNYYEVLEIPTINRDVLDVAALSANFSSVTDDMWPLSSYPLSSFYGWGLDVPVSDYYFFYQYLSGSDNSQVEGLIDWDNTNTTLSESISSIDDWYKDGGIVDLIFNYYIFKGLNLIRD